MRSDNPMKELIVDYLGIAIIAVLAVVALLSLGGCSFTAIRYEEPDCASCAARCQKTNANRR